MKHPDWLHAYNIEREFAIVLARQEQYGWLFDREGAERLVADLILQEEEHSISVLQQLPDVMIKGKELNAIFKAAGGYSHYVNNWFDSLDIYRDSLPSCLSNIVLPGRENRILGGPFTRIDYSRPNLKSSKQLKSALYSVGWEPDEWNYKKDKNKKILRDSDGSPIKTSPKITETSLESIDNDSKFAKELILLLKIQARLKFFGCYGNDSEDEDEDDDDEYLGKGLLSHIRPDNTVPSEVIQCGTNTGRVQHRKVANVPRVGSYLGKETRSLFIARPGRILVGTDYSGLESYIMAHAIYLFTKWKYGKGDTRFIEIIQSVPDIHTYLWDDLRDLVSTRAGCKTINYAFPYGAQASKLGLYCDIRPSWMSKEKAGARVLEVMNDKFPGLVETRDATVEQARNGTLPGLDGRIIYVRSPHSAFNAKIQGWGSEVVKKGNTLRYKEIRRQNIDSEQVGYYHDEWQAECLEGLEKAEIEISQKAIKDSGIYYNLSVEMHGESKCGKTWADTH